MQPEQAFSPPIDIRTENLERRRAPTYSVRKLSENAAPIRRLDELTHIIGRASNNQKDSTYLSREEYRRSTRIAEGVKEQQDSKSELQKVHEQLLTSRAILKSYQENPESKMAGHYRVLYHQAQEDALGAWVAENNDTLLTDLTEVVKVINPFDNAAVDAERIIKGFTDTWKKNSGGSPAAIAVASEFYSRIKHLIDQPEETPERTKALEVWNKLAAEIGTITEGKIVISQKGRTVADLLKAGQPVDVVQLNNEKTEDTAATADPRGIVVTDVRTPGLCIDDSIIAPVDEPINAKVVGEYHQERIIYTDADYDEALEKVEESRHAFYRAAVAESADLYLLAEQYDSVQKKALQMWVKSHGPLLLALISANSHELEETDRNKGAKATIRLDMEYLDPVKEFSEVAIDALIPLYKEYPHWDVNAPLDTRTQTSKEVYDALKKVIEQISHGVVLDQDDLAAMSESEIKAKYGILLHPVEVRGFDGDDIGLRDKRHSVVTDVYEPGLYVDESLPERVKRVFGERQANVKTTYTLSKEDQEKNRKPAAEQDPEDDIAEGEFRILEQHSLEDKSITPPALLSDHGGKASAEGSQELVDDEGPIVSPEEPQRVLDQDDPALVLWKLLHDLKGTDGAALRNEIIANAEWLDITPEDLKLLRTDNIEGMRQWFEERKNRYEVPINTNEQKLMHTLVNLISAESEEEQKKLLKLIKTLGRDKVIEQFTVTDGSIVTDPTRIKDMYNFWKLFASGSKKQ